MVMYLEQCYTFISHCNTSLLVQSGNVFFLCFVLFAAKNSCFLSPQEKPLMWFQPIGNHYLMTSLQKMCKHLVAYPALQLSISVSEMDENETKGRYMCYGLPLCSADELLYFLEYSS